jgi:MFS family permease
MTLFAVFAGSLADAIGLRKAILLGLAVTVASRAVMTFTTVKWLALAGGMLPLALGEALGGPVLAAGVRRYSTTAQRSISFALFYALMNGGFIIADFIFDHVRQGLGEPHGHLALPWLRLDFTTYRVLFLISLLIEVSLLPIAWFALRDGVEATDHGVKITPAEPRHPDAGLWNAFRLMTSDALRETVRIFAGLWRQRGFYKFLAFLGLAAFVRLIFIHMYYTYPKFGIRELGEGAPVGRLFAINSVLILFLVPIVGALTQRISAYRMVSAGSAIAAASVFFMALPPRWFQPLADGALGHGIANAWLGGDARFSPDDFPDLPALAAKLQSPSDPVAGPLGQALSEPTRALLGRELPERAAGLGPHPSSALFAAGDISGAAALAARLRDDANAATRPISAFVWSRFSPASRALLADATRTGPGRQAVLAQQLNRILHGTTLYDARRFAGVALSPAALALLEQHPNQAKAGTLPKAGRMPAPGLPNQTLLLNRLLLEDTFPRELARSAHPLRVALAEDLGAIIRNGPLNELPGFPSLALATKEKAQLAKTPQGTKLARLNRRLLEEAFPSEIARNRAGVPGSVNPYYVMIFLFIALLSVGESIYSPRLYEYAAAIAPKGQEASYMSLSYLPFFLAKLPVAMFSGVLLARFCPETGPRNSAALWLIIALTTTIAPAGLLLLRRCIQVPEAGREPIN